MVLEQKNNPGDYGSFEKTLPSSNGVLENACTSGGLEADVLVTAPANDTVAPSEADALVQEVYQSQPLLPCSAKEDWSSESRLYLNHPASTSGANAIKIDIPAPSREEPRFPREKWKTFLGR
jgi:hypothetical protein